jgi:hypothetical protein
MTSTRGNCRRILLGGLSILASCACATTASAQGFGPDPFQPYNHQFEPYTRPVGPAGPGNGQVGGLNSRIGGRRDNDFANYLNELAGTGRAGAERFGIGMPYYRSSVDSRFDTEGKREYRPNRKADAAYEQTQELISQKYFAYFAERDPARRAALIRDYNQSRRRLTRALATRRESPRSILDRATGPLSELGSRPAASGLSDIPAPRRDSTARTTEPAQTGSSSTSRSSDSPSIRSGPRPPAPALPPGAARRPRRTPSEVLKRAQGTTP